MQLRDYCVLTYCLKEINSETYFESCIQKFFIIKYRICLLFVVGVVYFIIRKTITNSISNNFLKFMFILPQKYLKAIKFNKKLVFTKISDMWAVTQIIYHLFN